MEGINEMVVGEEQVGRVIICTLWIEFALENGGKNNFINKFEDVDI